MILERIGKDRFKLRAPKFVCHAYLIVVITATWVLFRSETLSQASLFLVAMAGFAPVATSVYSLIECIDGQALVALSFGILASTRFFPKMNLFLKRFSLKLGGSYQYGINVIKLIIYGFILFLCWMAIAGSTHAPFIYAKF